MIKSANQHAIHSLLSHNNNAEYRVPPYQREYSWQVPQWEELFDDLIEAEGAHFLGTIITLNQTADAIDASVLELVDGQQRMTTITLLMAAVYRTLQDNIDELSEDDKFEMQNLRRQIVRSPDGRSRVIPQIQGHNQDDYKTVLAEAGLNVEADKQRFVTRRRIHRCYKHFQQEIGELAERDDASVVATALRVLSAVNEAIIVKIEVESHADAFVLFESLNNRGMPLTPVDLIKNHLLAEAERQDQAEVSVTFKRWNSMLINLGDNYATQERFLRQYYNAFKTDLPTVTSVSVATRANLIRIYEALIRESPDDFLDDVTSASLHYGRFAGTLEIDSDLDQSLLDLAHAQGSPSYILLLWLFVKRDELRLEDDHLETVVDRLVNFFVRRNLTGEPATYALPKLFMDTIELIAKPMRDGSKLTADETLAVIDGKLADASADDDRFIRALSGPIYEDNKDMVRFILATLAEDQMTRETFIDLWQRQSGTPPLPFFHNFDETMKYRTFAAMIATSSVVMLGLMYLNTYSLDHIFWSETRFYMAILMGATMAIVMLAFMFGMYKNKKANIGIFVGSAIVFVTSLFLVRSQQTVDDVSWMRAMIPHHSIAILTSERANISDPRVRKLADEIIEAQRNEIAEMKKLIAELER